MGSEGTVLKISDAVLGGLVGEAIGSLRRASENSPVARAIRSHFRVDETSEAMEDLIKRAFVEAADGTGASRTLIHDFTANHANREAIGRLVADPDSELDVRTTMASNDEEVAQLNLLAGRLRESVRRALERQISPEGHRLLGSVAAAQQSLTSEIRSSAEQTAAHLDRIEGLFTDHVSVLAATTSHIVVESAQNFDGPRPDGGAALAKAAWKQGHFEDAVREAELVIAEIGRTDSLTDDSRRDLRTAHQVLADVLVAHPDTAMQARPHLDTVLRLWDGPPEGRLTTRAVIRLLDGEFLEALRLADEALALNPVYEAARNIKANALVRLGRAGEAVDMYIGQDAEQIAMRAWLLRMNHDYGAARESARAVLSGFTEQEARGPRLHAAHVFAEVVLLELAPLYEYGAKPNAPEAEPLLLEAVGYLDGLLEVVGEQRPAVKAETLLYRASLRDWAGLPGVKEDLEESVRLAPNNERAVRNLIVALLSDDETKRAEEHSERLLDLDGSAEATRLAISVSMQNGHVERAAERLERLGADPSASPDDAEAVIMLADAYGSLFRTREVEDAIDAVEAGGHAPFGVALARVRQAARLGADVREVLEAAARLPVPEGDTEQARREIGRWRLIQVTLGSNLLAAGDSVRAADLLAPFARADAPDATTLHYAASLLNTKRYPECLDVCGRALTVLDEGSGLAVEFECVAAAVYVNLESFVDAAERYARVLPGRQERTRDLVAWGSALVRLAQPDRALDILRLAEARVADDPARLAAVGIAYAEAGDMPKALDLSYRALDLAFDDERYHRSFAGLFLTHGHQISNAGPLDRKYLDRFHDILHNHATRFPKDEPFVRMETVPEDPDEMLDMLVKLVRPAHEAQAHIRTRFLEGGQAPLGTVAEVLNRNQVEVWETVTSNRKWGRLAFPGGREDRAASTKTAETATTVAADPSALITLHGLGLLREALQSFDEVLVPQTFIDELHHAVNQGRSNPGGEQLNVGLDDSGTQLSVTEIPAELLRARRDRLEELFATLTYGAMSPAMRDCRITGRPATPPGPIATDDPSVFLDVLRDAAEAALVAEARSVPLLSDGVLVRRQALAVGRLETTDSLGVIGRLAQNATITPAQAEDARLQLMAWGYRYVSISSETLLRTVVREAGLSTDRSRLPFDYLVEEESEPLSATGVVLSFLTTLWETNVWGPLPESVVRRQWTATAFVTLARLVSPQWARRTVIAAVAQARGPLEQRQDALLVALAESIRQWNEFVASQPGQEKWRRRDRRRTRR